jgi:acyl carrier protein
VKDAETIIQYIRTALLQDGDDVQIMRDENLLERVSIDSVGVVQLVSFLEQEFNVTIRAGDVTIKNFQSVDAMLALIERKRGTA